MLRSTRNHNLMGVYSEYLLVCSYRNVHPCIACNLTISAAIICCYNDFVAKLSHYVYRGICTYIVCVFYSPRNLAGGIAMSAIAQLHAVPLPEARY